MTLYEVLLFTAWSASITALGYWAGYERRKREQIADEFVSRLYKRRNKNGI